MLRVSIRDCGFTALEPVWNIMLPKTGRANLMATTQKKGMN